MPQIERVTPEEILSQEGASKPVVPYTFLQMVGVQLAIGVGGLMGFVIVALVTYWICTAPAPTPITNLSDPERVRQAIDFQKQVRDSQVSAVMQIFDTVVVKCLLPLFTSILGYIFGSQSVSRARN